MFRIFKSLLDSEFEGIGRMMIFVNRVGTVVLILTESWTSASAVGVRGVMIHLKGTGCLLKESNFIVVYICIDVISLRYYATSELRFELDGIPLVVNRWFDVIDCEKTGCN